MTEQWDGRPQNPERDGWHWLMQDALLYPARWDEAASAWHQSRFCTPHEIARLNDYCGPCLTPAEVEARVAAARREALEEAAKIALRIEVPADAGPIDGHARVMASVQIAAALRALLTEDGR